MLSRALGYPVLAFFFGAFATVAQVILLREGLVVLEGNELILSISLAAWLVGVGTGAVVGGRWSDRTSNPATAIAFSGALLTVAVPLAAISLRSTRSILGLEPGVLVSPHLAVLICLVSMAPASFGVGLSFAPLVKANDLGQDLRRASSLIYAIEGAGAFVGGLLFTFILAGRASAFVVLGCAGAVLTGACAAVLVKQKSASRGLALAGLSAVWCVVALSGGLSTLEQWTANGRWRSVVGVGSVVARVDTPYQHLELAEREGQFNLYSNGTPVLSFPDPYERAGPVHIAMTQGDRTPRRILMIGGGVADRVTAVLEHSPDAVDYLGLDPSENEIIGPYLSEGERQLLGDARVRLIAEDGRHFVFDVEPGTYDLVIVESQDPTTALSNRYFTRDFFRACASALEPDGVLSARVGSSVDFGHADVGAPAAVLYHSLREVFGEVAVWPGQTMRMYASRRAETVSDDSSLLAARWRARSGSIISFSEYRFQSVFLPSEVAEAHRRLQSLEPLENRDARPIAYLYGLALWDQRARASSSPSPLWMLSQVGAFWVFIPLLILLLGRSLWRRRARRPLDGVWATFVGGSVGLALEVMLLFIYQNAEGSLYATIGVLVALFMAGLTAGTLFSERQCALRSSAGVRRWASWVDLAMIVVVLTTPALAYAGGLSSWLTGAWLVGAGLCTGGIFPPAVDSLRATFHESGGGRPVGIADASDHIGACIGALGVGLVFLPIGGLWGAALFLAVIKASSLVGWLHR